MFKKLLLLVTLITTITVGQHITGAGTVGDPYILYNAADFDSIRYLGIGLGKYYKLGSDIDLSTISPFTAFNAGTDIYLDGDNYTISNLYLTSGRGLFPEVNQPTFKNLYFFKPRVVATVNSATFGNSTAAVLAGQNTCGSSGCMTTYSNIHIDSAYVEVYYGTSGSIDGPKKAAILAAGISDSDIMENCSVTNSTLKVYSVGGPYARPLIDVGIFAAGWAGNIIRASGNYAKNNTIYFNSDNNHAGVITFRVGGMVGAIVPGSGTVNGVLDNYIDNISITQGGTSVTSQIGGFTGVIASANTASVNRNYIRDVTINVLDSSALFAGNVIDIDVALTNSIADTSSSNIKTVVGYNTSGNSPLARDISVMTDSAVYLGAGWDLEYRYFGDNDTVAIWNQHYSVNDGYPYLYWEHLPVAFASFAITSPLQDDVYYLQDTVSIEWTSDNADTVYIYYTDDVEFSWTLIDSIKDDGSSTYKWLPPASGFYEIKLVDKTTSTEAISGEFEVVFTTSINILSPIDSSATVEVGDTIDIVIESINIDSLNIYYAVDDTTNWILIVENIAVNPTIDTTTFRWVLPNVFGSIWFKVANVNDTSLYVFNQNVYPVSGTNLPSQPAICWYVGGYFGGSPIWPANTRTPFFYARWVDQSCGWGYNGSHRHSSYLKDDATGYDHYYETDYMSVGDMVDNGPYRPIGQIGFYTALDTAYEEVDQQYDYAYIPDSLEYKSRLYFFVSTDSTLRCLDMINNIDSIFVADLASSCSTAGKLPYVFQIYNVQRSKYAGEYISVAIEPETLNDPLFEPLILISFSAPWGRGDWTVRVEALDAPPSQEYVQDVARIFQDLRITRDYFRGIDPKARKSGR